MYQLVVFDWDGTLMDSTLKIANCLRAAANDLNLPLPTIQAAKHVIGLGLDECMQTLFPMATQAQRQTLVENYKHHFVNTDKTEQTLFDGVIDGLAKLDATGALLAVATGKSRVGLDRVLSQLDVGRHFVFTRCADEARTKPNPQMLHDILDFTAIDANKAIMVGDTTYDMDMASNAGISALGVSYGSHDEAALLANRAMAVQHSATDMINWLLDGRIQNAYD